jgi:CubicO group peptidase (beta-lactamase class C family)
MNIDGICDERFAGVRDAFETNLKERGDVGASFAMSVDGEMVVDLWGGYADEAGERPWKEDTIVNVYSTTKTMAALCLLVLADRGELDLKAPVASYWPEFAANGKEKVTAAHFMSHSAGLSGLDTPVTEHELYDWDRIVTLLAEQAPWWEPGSQSGYHAITQGYLLGEVVRRVTGKTLGTYFAEEIAGPLGADFHIGLGREHFDRVADLIPPEAPPQDDIGADPGSVAARTFANPPIDALWSRTAAWREAEIPAANGHGNARSVVRAQTPVACGGNAFGVDLLSKATVDGIFEEQTNGVDLVLAMPVRFGMGYGLQSELVPLGPNKNVCFWGGWGGSLCLVDCDARVCMSYVMNKMVATLTGDLRSASLVMAAYEGLATR